MFPGRRCRFQFGRGNLAKGDDTVNGFPIAGLGDTGISDSSVSDSNVIDPADIADPPLITHQGGKTRHLEPKREDDESAPTAGRAAAKLCRLAFELANQTDTRSVAQVALQGLLESTNADYAEVLC